MKCKGRQKGGPEREMHGPILDGLQIENRIRLFSFQDVALQDLSSLAFQVKDRPPLRMVHGGRAEEGAQQEGHAARHRHDLKAMAPTKRPERKTNRLNN